MKLKDTQIHQKMKLNISKNKICSSKKKWWTLKIASNKKYRNVERDMQLKTKDYSQNMKNNSANSSFLTERVYNFPWFLRIKVVTCWFQPKDAITMTNLIKFKDKLKYKRRS